MNSRSSVAKSEGQQSDGGERRIERKAKALLSCFRRLDIGQDPSCTFRWHLLPWSPLNGKINGICIWKVCRSINQNAMLYDYECTAFPCYSLTLSFLPFFLPTYTHMTYVTKISQNNAYHYYFWCTLVFLILFISFFLSADPLDLFQDSLIGYDLLYENHSCERAATSEARHRESVEENLVYWPNCLNRASARWSCSWLPVFFLAYLQKDVVS